MGNIISFEDAFRVRLKIELEALYELQASLFLEAHGYMELKNNTLKELTNVNFRIERIEKYLGKQTDRLWAPYGEI